MKILKSLMLPAIAAALLLGTAHNAPAQVSVSIGEPPACPYGYYEAPPYNCAPDGYYGPEWFTGGVFIGAGPGSTVRRISTGMWIISSITVRVTRGQCPRVALHQHQIERRLRARRCMIHTARKLLAGTSKL